MWGCSCFCVFWCFGGWGIWRVGVYGLYGEGRYVEVVMCIELGIDCLGVCCDLGIGRVRYV